MKTLSIRLPDPLDRKLSALAKKRRKKKETLVKQALEAYLAESPQGQAKTFADAARGWIGSVNGPGDLNTNKTYMEGFGRDRRHSS